MFKIFFANLLLLISISSFAQGSQTRVQIGQKLAECAAYDMNMVTIGGKIANDPQMMKNGRERMDRKMTISQKLIGKEMTSQIFISTSQLTRSYQSNPQAYVDFIAKQIQACDDYVANNENSISQALK